MFKMFTMKSVPYFICYVYPLFVGLALTSSSSGFRGLYVYTQIYISESHGGRHLIFGNMDFLFPFTITINNIRVDRFRQANKHHETL